jgi:hypothetical protein
MNAYLVQILLPMTRSRRSRTNLEAVKAELAEKFGGVTMHLDAPAEGLWEDEGNLEDDRIVVTEVMADIFDRDWWAEYRAALEVRFRQDEIVVRALQIERL